MKNAIRMYMASVEASVSRSTTGVTLPSFAVMIWLNFRTFALFFRAALRHAEIRRPAGSEPSRE
jgi:hypothetical protein